MKIIDYDPSRGAARQGDVVIWPLPAGCVLNRSRPIASREGRLILAEGEATGHHHSILARVFDPPRFRDDAMAQAAESALNTCGAPGIARLFSDDSLTRRLAGSPLTATDLCVGYLAVDGGPVVLEHQEHDAHRIPPGIYYVVRQREFSAGEMHHVQD